MDARQGVYVSADRQSLRRNKERGNWSAAQSNEGKRVSQKEDNLVNNLKSKISIQRTEIARLTQKLEKLTKEKSELLTDIKWLRGEK
tara:strand:- start:1332 stop:1592 length:261 start_codon:yes stop_codon:yes gene_type:complete